MPFPIDEAVYQCGEAFEHLSVAKWAASRSEKEDFHRRIAVEHIAKCIEALGFDLVKRQPVDEKALEMHFSDGAIPAVTEAPGFDGRAPVIADNEWSR